MSRQQIIIKLWHFSLIALLLFQIYGSGNNKTWTNYQFQSEESVITHMVILLTAGILESWPSAVWPSAPDGCHPATVAVARRLNVVAEAIEGAGALPAGAPVMLGEWKARLCETTERAHLDMRKPSPRNYL